jgi:hypothetical protein
VAVENYFPFTLPLECSAGSDPAFLGLAYVEGIPRHPNAPDFPGRLLLDLTDNNLVDPLEYRVTDTTTSDEKIRFDVCVDTVHSTVSLKRAVITDPTDRWVYALEFSAGMSDATEEYSESTESGNFFRLRRIKMPLTNLNVMGLQELIFDGSSTKFAAQINIPATATFDTTEIFVIKSVATANQLPNLPQSIIVVYRAALSDAEGGRQVVPIENQLHAGSLQIVEASYLATTKCSRGGSIIADQTSIIAGYEVKVIRCAGGRLNGTQFPYVASLKIKHDGEIIVESDKQEVIDRFYRIQTTHHNECDAIGIKFGVELEYFANPKITATLRNNHWTIVNSPPPQGFEVPACDPQPIFFRDLN